MAKPVDVSLAHFAKFVGAATPSARIGAVTRAREKYEPSHDYYKGLRDAIQRGHRKDDLSDELRRAVAKTHPKKAENYKACATGYRQFVRKGGFTWIDQPRPRLWTSGGLRVRINPEVYAEVGGEDMVLRLIWSDGSMPALGRRVLQHLIDETYSRDEWTAGLVDMRRGVMVRTGAGLASPNAYLASEAAAFLSLWSA